MNIDDVEIGGIYFYDPPDKKSQRRGLVEVTKTYRAPNNTHDIARVCCVPAGHNRQDIIVNIHFLHKI